MLGTRRRGRCGRGGFGHIRHGTAVAGGRGGRLGRGGGAGRSRGARRSGIGFHDGNGRAHGHHLAFLHQNFGQYAGVNGWYFGIDFIGGYFQH